MKKLILALLLPVLVFSQKRELGEVTLKELQEKQHPIDTSAVAAILYEKGNTTFSYTTQSGFTIETEVEVKIKIYKKEGYDWATKEITYQIGANDEVVIFSKANTYNLVNGKIVKTKLNSDGEFTVKNNEYWATKKITMPNVKEGSIIEYKYLRRTPFITKLSNWKFQTSIPVNYSEYTTHIPEYFNYNVYTRGSLKILTKVELEKKSLSYTTGAGKLNTSGNGNQMDSFDFNETKTKYYIENAPAFKSEAFSNTSENYLTGIEFELSSTRYPNSGIQQYSQTWDDVVKTIYDNDSFGKELDKMNYYDEDLKVLLSGKFENDNAKINKIFEFVKNRIKWNDFVGIYADKGVRRAYIDKIGNSAEINFILISMLRSAGFQANPILISTRNKPINLFPSRTAYNYVICGVEINNEIIYLDATDKNATFDILPIHDLNYMGRIIRKSGSSADVPLTPKKSSKKSVSGYVNITTDAKLEGNIKEQVTDTRAYKFRDANNRFTEESYLEQVEKSINGLEIKEYKLINKDSLLAPIKEDYNFVLSDDIEVINNKYYFKPLIFFAIDSNPFKSETREYPIDFIYPSSDSYTFTYIIPDGYEVESLPESVNIAMAENALSFKFVTGNSGNRIQVICNFNINMPLLMPAFYADLKEFYNQVYLKMNEKIVLKKV